MDGGVEFVAGVARVGEALEVHHQQLRQAPQVQLLLRAHVLLAPPAVPRVCRVQLLRLQERLRTDMHVMTTSSVTIDYSLIP